MTTQEEINQHNYLIGCIKRMMYKVYHPKNIHSGPDKTLGLNILRENPPITLLQLFSMKPIKSLDKGLKRLGEPLPLSLQIGEDFCNFSVSKVTETNSYAKKNGYKYDYIFKYERPDQNQGHLV